MSIVSVDNIQPIGSGTTVTVNKSVTLESGNTNITGVCTATSFSGSGANLTSLPAQATIANNADNRVITGGSGVNLNGESTLTYDGSTLTVKGASNTTQAVFSGTGGSGSRGLEIVTESVGAADEGVILNARASGTTGRIKMQTNDVTAMTIDGSSSNGNVTLNTGNLIIGTAGKGIDFSITSNASITGASMSSELLDDYEEGSWTPYFIVNGGTSGVTQPSSMQGRYTKIGDRVCVNAWGNGTLVYTGSTGHAVNMKGLPFNAVAGNMFSAFSHWLYRFATNVNDVNKHIIFRTNNGSDQIEVQKNNGSGCTYADFNGVSGNWIIAAQYVADGS